MLCLEGLWLSMRGDCCYAERCFFCYEMRGDGCYVRI